MFDAPEVVAVEASQGPLWEGEWPEERFTWLCGACLAVRREGFERVGGFDTRLFLYAEDMDLSWRLAQLGRLAHCSEAVFAHDRGRGTVRSNFWKTRNTLRVRRR